MNILSIPYHDWRKILREGFRTRDAHIIEKLKDHELIDKLLVINRPYSFLEYILKMKAKRIEGKVLYQNGKGKLIEISPNLYLIDYNIWYSISVIWKKRKWYIDMYNNPSFISFINTSIEILDLKKDLYGISFNVFAAGVTQVDNVKQWVFDAWDNFSKFPNLKSISGALDGCYEVYTTKARWITNSNKNVKYFTEKYKINNIKMIPNGVDIETLEDISKTNDSLLRHLKKPIVGFGGKFTHLIDVELINFIIKDNPDATFVFMGQQLDKNVFNKIEKKANFTYLGDLPYKDYIRTISSFDVAIIPYVVDKNDHGGDSIKLYEYLACRKQIVSTIGNGAEKFAKYIFLAENKKEFSLGIKEALSNPKDAIDKAILNTYSWRVLLEQYIELLKK